MRANPKLSGTKHNVFGIQTGVAISFMVKKVSGTGCRSVYTRRPVTMETPRRSSASSPASVRELDFDEVQPDRTHNWLNLTSNDFETLMPLASKDTKTAKAAKEVDFQAVFAGVPTGMNGSTTSGMNPCTRR